MPNDSPYKAALQKLFRTRPVALLDDLRQALKRQSRTTILHALRAVGYLTSYSHAGRYLHPRTHPAVRLQRPLAVSPDWLLLAGNLARHPDPFGGDLTGRPDPHLTPGPPASARARDPASPGACA